MYTAVLLVHSFVRWVIVVLGFIAVWRAFQGRGRRLPWSDADSRVALLLTIAFDVQLLLGLLLYLFFSPTTTLALHRFGLAISSRVLRFWALEHPVVMLGALAFVHIGRVRIRREGDAVARHRIALLYFGVALVLVLLGMPWPVMPYGRPLWPIH